MRRLLPGYRWRRDDATPAELAVVNSSTGDKKSVELIFFRVALESWEIFKGRFRGAAYPGQ